jgi:MoxR-like ATPase
MIDKPYPSKILKDKHKLKEEIMTDTTTDTEVSAIDEIFSVLNGRQEEIKAKAKTPEPEKPKVTLIPTDWVTRPDGNEERMNVFSAMFWEPTVVPDHHVPEFRGYDSAKAPSIYIPPIAEFEQLSLAVSLGLRVNIVGPTGAGKTLMYEYYSSKTGRPYLRIEHNGELDKATVFGQTHLSTDEAGNTITDFVPGVFVRSANEPTLVNLDELTRATSYANLIYQRPLDRNEIFLPEMKDASLMAITPDPYWFMCASDNTKGNGDDMDMYSASNVQDAAFINRWDMVIEQDYLTAKQEETLFKALSPSTPKGVAKNLAKFSALIHAGFHKGEVQTAFSPRNLVAIAKLMEAGVEIRQAIQMNYISRVSKSEVSDVHECLRSAFGTK